VSVSLRVRKTGNVLDYRPRSVGFHGGSHCRAGYGRQLHDTGAAVIFDDLRRLPDLIARVGREVG
jgi:hypothetical protein